MRLVLFSLAASLAVAAPAMAQGEAKDMGARFDVHTGAAWNDGRSIQGTVGATLGYDIATGGNTFVGLEESVDKVLTSQDKARFSTTARLGIKATPNDKVYGLAGYTYGAGPNGAHIGGGVEHSLGQQYFTKVEYRHTFNEQGAKDSNAGLVGVGVRF